MKELFKRNSKQVAPNDNAEVVKSAADNGEQSKDEQTPNFTQAKHGKGRNIPDDLWVKCPKCRELLYSKELSDNKKVCQKCGHHFRLNARERIASLVDENSFQEIDANLISADPLNFECLVEPPYRIKAQKEREKTKLNEAILSGLATIEGLPLVLSVADFSFQGGSMGSVFGEKLVRAIETAIEKRLPLLSVSTSGGARMHEGIFSLMQMAKTTAALAKLSEAGLMHISLLVDPVTGGVFASYATVADYIIAEPGALIGFTGPRVIEQVIRQKLPPGFQTAEFVLEHGQIDLITHRKELHTTLAHLLSLYAETNKPKEIKANGHLNGVEQVLAETEAVYAK